MYTLGIDIHKKYSQVAVLDSQGKFQMDIKLSNTRENFSRLLNDLDEPCEAVIEAGYTWGVMYDLLSEIGIDVSVAHALKVKAIASAKIKTDKIDARILAQLLRANLIPEIYVPATDVRRQRNILRQRSWLVRLKTMVKNKIHSILSRNHIQTPDITDIFGKCGMKFLHLLTLPDPDQTILAQDLELLGFVNEQIKSYEKLIKNMAVNNNYIKIILSAPGFGDNLSALVALEIVDINRFPTAAKLSSYSGLVPTTYSSGGKTSHGNLIPTCNHWLRYAFIEASWVAIVHDPYFRALYSRLKKIKGPQAAIAAVARRLSEVIFNCLRQNRFYEQRIYKYKNNYSNAA